MQDVLEKSTVATIVIYGSSCGSPWVFFSGTTVNDSETIGRTNGVNHRQSIDVAVSYLYTYVSS